MKKLITVLLIATLSQFFAENLTLKRCRQLLLENHSITKKSKIHQEIYTQEKKGFNKKYLPDFSISGSASYQSETVEIKVDLSNLPLEFPESSQDKYQISMNISQNLFDGFAKKNTLKLKEFNQKSDNLADKISLRNLEERMNSLYFNILLLQSKIKIYQLSKNSLLQKQGMIVSHIENGMKIESDKLVIDCEILDLDNKIEALKKDVSSLFENLSILLSTSIPKETQLEIPTLMIAENQNEINRDEIKLLKNNSSKLDASQKLINAKYLPQINAFGQFSYGKPGFDMFSNEMHDFYNIGINFQWKFWDWQQLKNEKKIIKHQQELLAIEEEIFRNNLSQAISAKQNEIENIRQQIKNDEKLVGLRQQILESYSVKLQNGTITSTEYVANSNAFFQAKERLQTDKINLSKKISEYKLIRGE